MPSNELLSHSGQRFVERMKSKPEELTKDVLSDEDFLKLLEKHGFSKKYDKIICDEYHPSTVMLRTLKVTGVQEENMAKSGFTFYNLAAAFTFVATKKLINLSSMNIYSNYSNDEFSLNAPDFC